MCIRDSLPQCWFRRCSLFYIRNTGTIPQTKCLRAICWLRGRRITSNGLPCQACTCVKYKDGGSSDEVGVAAIPEPYVKPEHGAVFEPQGPDSLRPGQQLTRLRVINIHLPLIKRLARAPIAIHTRAVSTPLHLLPECQEGSGLELEDGAALFNLELVAVNVALSHGHTDAALAVFLSGGELVLEFLALFGEEGELEGCLLYTSDAADEEDSVDLGGRRII
eukprot:TRINITY_DN16540_c0_g1_i3.p1 TRINITY_DN16540_c0_g1~~TRINITY_DN16540_c0_g1_i3.p1  ORF type:complete len:221 (-),score=30.34 TRINITY_DN16540_c0_g1_i3:84-746(-)